MTPLYNYLTEFLKICFACKCKLYQLGKVYYLYVQSQNKTKNIIPYVENNQRPGEYYKIRTIYKYYSFTEIGVRLDLCIDRLVR